MQLCNARTRSGGACRRFGNVSADGEYNSDAGSACDGGAAAIGEAAGEGMQKILNRLGEAFASSTRLRDALKNQ